MFSFTYYSGHGILDMTTKVVMNSFSDDDLDRYFALESRLSVLANYQNTYLMAVFDCCREVKPVSQAERAMP